MIIGDIEVTLEATDVVIGIVSARGCDPAANVEAEVAAAIASAASVDEVAKKAARDMLRFGKYKPTGRGKPASEYLLQAALEGAFPRINALVDLCNAVSLQTLLPISLIDLERADVTRFLVRRGRTDESYVFNSGGQTIALEDLLLTARMPHDEPCANAVKDSLTTKLGADARDVLAVIYAHPSRRSAATTATETLAKMYARTGARVEQGLLT